MTNELALWCHRSFNLKIQEISQDIDVPNHYLGDHRNTVDLKEYTESRLLGPYVTSTGNKSYQINLEARIIVTASKSHPNLYRVHEIGGRYQAELANFKIFDTGDSLKYCLLTDRKPVRWDFYGQIEPDLDIVRGFVTAYYSLEI